MTFFGNHQATIWWKIFKNSSIATIGLLWNSITFSFSRKHFPRFIFCSEQTFARLGLYGWVRWQLGYSWRWISSVGSTSYKRVHTCNITFFFFLIIYFYCHFPIPITFTFRSVQCTPSFTRKKKKKSLSIIPPPHIWIWQLAFRMRML